jgi:chromosome segregation ATPase
VHALQHQMKRKDGQIANLDRDLHALSSDLSHSHNELASKQEHVEKLTSELEDLRSQANQSATTRVLELTQDEAESVDQMRSHIVSLAKALEKSEGRRADAIERLEKERQANADSLRRLTESVKRFYSTLSLAEG